MSNSKSRPAVAQVSSEHPDQALESCRPVGSAELPILRSVGMAEGKRGAWCVYVLETQGTEVVSRTILNEDGNFLPRAAATNMAKVAFVKEILEQKREVK